MRYRGSIAKWIFLAMGLLFMMNILSNKDKSASIGLLSSGMIITFGILHAGDRLANRVQRIVSQREPSSTDKP